MLIIGMPVSGSRISCIRLATPTHMIRHSLCRYKFERFIIRVYQAIRIRLRNIGFVYYGNGSIKLPFKAGRAIKPSAGSVGVGEVDLTEVTLLKELRSVFADLETEGMVIFVDFGLETREVTLFDGFVDLETEGVVIFADFEGFEIGEVTILVGLEDLEIGEEIIFVDFESFEDSFTGLLCFTGGGWTGFGGAHSQHLHALFRVVLGTF